MTEDKNRILHEEGGYAIGTYDDFNFFVGKVSELKSGKKAGKKVFKNMRYYGSIDRAIIGFARVKAGALAVSIQDYVDKYADTTKKLRETAFKHLGEQAFS